MRISDWSSDVCSSDLHQAVGTEVRRPEMARDDDRRQHAEEVLGVDADRGEQGVSDDGAARVHQPASTKRTFTMSHRPTVLAAEATHHLNQSDCTRNVVRPAQRSWAPAYPHADRPSMM